MRVGIVGHESAKFTSEGEEKAKATIGRIFSVYIGPTLVSGRCPIAECEDCHRLTLIPAPRNPIMPLVGYFKCPLCGGKRAKRAGGIDIFAEVIADELGVSKDIKIPQQNWWERNDRGPSYGFKARNIDIATVSDTMFVIVVNAYPASYKKKSFDDDAYCFHCDMPNTGKDGHIRSGGCWTGKYFERLHPGVKANWIVIDQRPKNAV